MKRIKYCNQKVPKFPKFRKKKRITYKNYSYLCKFKFKIEDFPKEFDKSLISEFGWFDNENTNGMTRDHMLSISYGWKKDIPPNIMNHPANCELMPYYKNLEKGRISSITYDELLNKINDWDKKYKYLKGNKIKHPHSHRNKQC